MGDAEYKEYEAKIEEVKGKLAALKNWDQNPVPLATLAGSKEVKTAEMKLKQKRVLNALTGKVSAMDWAPDSRHLASASQDGKLIIWNAYTNNKDHFISKPSSWFMTCKYSPSGNMIAVGGLDNVCTVYKLPSEAQMESGTFDQKVFVSLDKHLGYIGTCGWFSEEEIITGSGDQSCILWDVATKTPRQTFTGHDGDAACLSILPGSKDVFVTGSTDHTAKLWDRRVKGTMCVCTFPGHEAAINAIKFFPSGVAFGTGADDTTCRLFDIRCFRQVNVYADDTHQANVTALDFSKSGKVLFAGHNDASCFVWDVATGDYVHELSSHEQHITGIGVSPDGKALAMSSRDTTLSIWA